MKFTTILHQGIVISNVIYSQEKKLSQLNVFEVESPLKYSYNKIRMSFDIQINIFNIAYIED